MRRTAGTLLTTVVVFAASTPALAQQAQPQVRPGAQSTITLRGFVSATTFLQDNSFGFGNGQNAAWAAGNPQADPWILSGDVRNTRLGMDFRGPPVGGGWSVNGTFEMDFFGGFEPGPFGDEMPLPRLRLAYADLTRGGTTIRIGQAWTPLFGNVPASVSHLAFPIGYGAAGMIGWRFPGIFLYQNLTEANAPMRAQLQLAAVRGSWVAPEAQLVNHLSPGEASGFPQLQARLDLTGATAGGMQWGTYVVGHYDRKDLSGQGATATNDELTGTAFQVGARLVPGPLTLQGNYYTGRAVGQHLAHITQFGDIGGWGAWGQAGFAFSPNWSTWLYYGMDNPNSGDVRRELSDRAVNPVNARLQNQIVSGMLRYSTGPYQFGIEWLRAETDWRFAATETNPAADQTRTGNQLAFSILYLF